MRGSAFAAEPSSMRRKVRVEDRRLKKVREEAEREHILSTLHLAKGNRGQTARILGISRKTLWQKLKHLGVAYPSNVTER